MFTAIEQNPQDLFFESQAPDEKVYFLLRKHPITNLGWILGSIVMILTPIVVISILISQGIDTFKYIEPKIQILLLLLWYLITMFMTFESFIIWFFNVYIITDKRLIDVDFAGLWSKRISETALGQVEDATYETHKFFEVLFDYGDILVQTAAEKSEFEFNSIPKPAIVHDKFTDLVEEYRNKHGR